VETVDIFYNCGDRDFRYILSDYIDGPNLNLISDQNTTSFFMFENQDLEIYYQGEFDSTECKGILLFPYVSYYDSVNLRNVKD
jgi:hypothetical protein